LFGATLGQDKCKGEVLVGLLVVAISVYDMILHPEAVIDEGQNLSHLEIAWHFVALVVYLA
jgi:hypothetical protein